MARVLGALGMRAFGGPAVHVALMRRELVDRRGWVDEATFRELFAACSVIPGPTSTQLALLLGRRRAGWRGLAAAAAVFAPSFVLVPLLGRLVDAPHRRPALGAALAGVAAAAVGLIGSTVLALARVAWVSPVDVALTVAGLAALVRWPRAQPWVVLGGGLAGAL